MVIYISVILILVALSAFILFKFYKYKQIVDEELKFYEDRLEDEIAVRKGVVLEYESKKHLLENPRPEDSIKIENKDIKKDLDQRTDKIYDYLTKISNQIDYLHYHQLDIPAIEFKRSKSTILNISEHHNYIEYILQSHNIKSEIDYFSHSLVASEVKILPFSFFVKRQDFNIIIDTKLLQFIREFRGNSSVENQNNAKDIFFDRIQKYFNYLSNPKYLKNIHSYFVKRRIADPNAEVIIVSIVPTQKELDVIQSMDLDIQGKNFKLIESGELYQFLS